MTHAAVFATLSACFVLGAAAACTATNSGSTQPDGGPAKPAVDGGVGDGSTTAPLTCLEIFQCGADCQGTGCEDECFARGTAEAKDATTKVIDCYQSNACDGGDCLRAKCSAEMKACGAQQEAPGGKPVGTVPPASAPPAALVGKWHSYYAPNAATEDWTFKADGTAAHYSASAYTMAAGCQWAGITDSTGTVVVTGTTLTYYQTAGTQLTNNCGFKTNESAPTNAYTFEWGIDASGKLVLVDQNSQSCIANPQYTSCRTTLDPQ